MKQDNMMMNDVIQNHGTRIQCLRRYYPFFRLMDTTFTQYKEGRFVGLDMAYIIMAVLRFFIEMNHFKDEPVAYESYARFIKGVLQRDFELSVSAEDMDELVQYIFDKLTNEGRPFEFTYFDPADHSRKVCRVRLMESELKNLEVRYYISSDAVEFYLDTKELKEESRINIAQLLLTKMIKMKNYQGGLEVISRINMEVGRIQTRRQEIEKLLRRHVLQGIAALEEYHKTVFAWFDEEQRLFTSNMALVAQVEQKLLEAGTISAAAQIYELDTALKSALSKHSALLNDYLQLQKSTDAALEKAKHRRFRSALDFHDIFEKMVQADQPELLGSLVLPMLSPALKKTLAFKNLDDALSYRPEEMAMHETEVQGAVKTYVYEDELEQDRMNQNFSRFFRVLFDQLMKKQEITLKYMNWLCRMKFSEQIFKNGDYYAFVVQLSQKKIYDLDRISEKQDTVLEGMMAEFLRQSAGAYAGLKFRLVYLADKEAPLEVGEGYEMTNIIFERTETADGTEEP